VGKVQLRRLSRGWLGCGVAAASLALYLSTLAPGIPPTDSGELALAAWTAGIAHAPGFPLYVVIGWLWTHLLPAGRIIWRLNLLSAVCGAATVGLIYLLAQRTLIAPVGRLRAAGSPSRFDAMAAAAIGALAFGLGRTAWTWAGIAEVYALNTALVAAILLWVVGGGRPERAAGERPEIHLRASERRRMNPAGTRPGAAAGSATHDRRGAWREGRALTLAAFLFGLGLGNHLTSVALLAPAIALWLTWRWGWQFWASRSALAAALALLAGAAIYLYLPLRATADPLLNWGQPDTAQRVWQHVTAQQYRVSLFSASLWPQVVQAAQLWWTQFTPIGLALALAGAWCMAKAQRALFWTLLAVIAFTMLYAWAYVIEDDGDAYYLPAFVAGAVWVAWGADAVWRLGSRLRLRLRAGEDAQAARVWQARAVGLVVIGAALTMNWAACDRRNDTIAEDYVRDAFAEIAEGGVLLTRDWQAYAPALYLQGVEGLRPDLSVIDVELLRRDWYFGFLRRADARLMAAVGNEERVFRGLRDAWERGDIPAGDPRIGQLQAAYIGLINAFIQQGAVAGRPVYIGPNRGAAPLRPATLNGQLDMEAGVGAGWRWVPVGLSFRAMTSAAPPPSLLPLAWRVAPFDQVKLTAPQVKVQATRADMATLRGRYQLAIGNQPGAEADWQTALAVDPQHGLAKELLERSKGSK